MPNRLTTLTGGSAVLAKSKLASMANEYTKKNVVPGGVKTVVGTWAKEYKLVEESKREKLTEELTEIAEMQKRHAVNTINRFGYNKLRAETKMEGIKESVSELFDEIFTDDSSLQKDDN
ncbi:hypothetical protein MA786_004664 [Vibrio parahaemolyticus]|nr:hypothetical protein [Vibrio parahaemolyticus]EGU8229560.1 hypothetical protein [Vibrio parahaemolyticus]EIA1620867.1 hypothetical protein [Vibrio parahaemolyticus]EIU6827695.1 hypothetical protein [Vibrio parahaemolyticus]EIV8641784.1 hypothetical protein [Vibrio parahaemolyticus]